MEEEHHYRVFDMDCKLHLYCRLLDQLVKFQKHNDDFCSCHVLRIM